MIYPKEMNTERFKSLIIKGCVVIIIMIAAVFKFVRYPVAALSTRIKKYPLNNFVMNRRNLKNMKLMKILFIFFLLAASSIASAATVTTIATGNWSSAAVWPGGAFPATTDDIIIGTGFTLTVDGNRTCNSMRVGNGSTISVNSGIILTVTTTLSFPNLAAASTTGAVSGAGTINAGSMSIGGTTLPTSSQTVTVTSTIATLSVTGSLTVTSQRNGANNNNPTFRLPSGSVTVSGTLSCVTANNAASTTLVTLATGAQTGTLVLANATPISTSGNTGVSTFTFTGTSATVNYSGAAQTVFNVNYTNLILSGSGAKTLQTSTTSIGGNLTISGTANTATVVALAITGNLSLGNGTTFTVAGFNLAVTGTTVIGAGISGQINFTSTTGTKTFGNSVTISAGATWNNSANDAVSMGGDLSVGGGATFTQGTGLVTFTGATSNTVTSSSILAFGGGITINKGTSLANVLDVQAVITMLSGGLTLTNGTFKLSSVSTITPFTANPNFGSTARLWCNGGTMSGSNTPVTYSGAIQVTAGTLNIGTSADNYLFPDGGSLTISGGALNVAGPLSDAATGTGAGMTFNMSGGICTVSTNAGNTIDYPFFTNPAFAPASTFTMSGGTLIIQNRSNYTANANAGYKNRSPSTVTGGTIQIGNSSTSAGSIIEIDTTQPIYDLTVNSSNVTARIQTQAITVSNDVTISSGTLNANSLGISVGGDWTNNGTFTPGTGTITLNSTSTLQTISGSASTSFYRLTLNNTSGLIPGITMSTATTATNTLTMTSGIVNLSSTIFTLGQSATASSLSRTASTTTNWMYGGTFKRFWLNATAITSTSGNFYGLFPLGSSIASSYEPFEVNSTGNPTAAGSYSVTHSNVSGHTDLSPIYDDAGTNIVRILNSQFVGSISGVTGGTYNINATMTGLLAGTLTDIRLAVYVSGTTASAVGTHVAATGTAPNPTAKRTGATVANLANDFRVSTVNSGATPLPITLVRFQGEENLGAVDLSWKTATELNNDFFTVLHSSTGSNFQSIGTIQGSGTTKSTHVYSLKDHSPSIGKNYYQLKQTDFDGKSTTSEVIRVDVTEVESSINVYPNPVSSNGILNIEIKGVAPNLPLHINLRNLQGESVSIFSATTDAQGTWKTSFQPAYISAGLYVLDIAPGVHRKFVIE